MATRTDKLVCTGLERQLRMGAHGAQQHRSGFSWFSSSTQVFASDPKNTYKSRGILQRIAGKLKTKHGRTRIIIKEMWKVPPFKQIDGRKLGERPGGSG